MRRTKVLRLDMVLKFPNAFGVCLSLKIFGREFFRLLHCSSRLPVQLRTFPVTATAFKAKTWAYSSRPWPIINFGLNEDTDDAIASISNTTKFQHQRISQHELGRIFISNYKTKLLQVILI